MVEKENKLECVECGDSSVGLEVTSKLWVKDRFVVFRMRIKDRDRIAEELMSRFLANNQIDEALNKEYRMALIDEFERRQEPYI
jgi:hypothetical protein